MAAPPGKSPPRKPPSGKPSGAKPASRPPLRLWQRPAVRRWGLVLGLAFAALLLLPIIHAFGGEVGVIVTGSFALGFLFGRGTA